MLPGLLDILSVSTLVPLAYSIRPHGGDTSRFNGRRGVSIEWLVLYGGEFEGRDTW
jgi:hypothetical protein